MLNNFILQDVVQIESFTLKADIMEEKIVTLKTYERMDEALLDQSVLSENKISSSIYNSTGAEILPMLYELDEGVALMVFEKDFNNAWEILKDYHRS